MLLQTTPSEDAEAAKSRISELERQLESMKVKLNLQYCTAA